MSALIVVAFIMGAIGLLSAVCAACQASEAKAEALVVGANLEERAAELEKSAAAVRDLEDRLSVFDSGLLSARSQTLQLTRRLERIESGLKSCSEAETTLEPWSAELEPGQIVYGRGVFGSSGPPSPGHFGVPIECEAEPPKAFTPTCEAEQSAEGGTE